MARKKETKKQKISKQEQLMRDERRFCFIMAAVTIFSYVMATLEGVFAYYGEWYDQIFTYVFPAALIFTIITIIKHLHNVYTMKLEAETLDIYDFKKVMYTGLVTGIVLLIAGFLLYRLLDGSGVSLIILGGIGIAIFIGGLWAQMGLASDELPAYTKMLFGASVLTILGLVVYIVYLVRIGQTAEAQQRGIMFLLPAIGVAAASYWAYGKDA